MQFIIRHHKMNLQKFRNASTIDRHTIKIKANIKSPSKQDTNIVVHLNLALKCPEQVLLIYYNNEKFCKQKNVLYLNFKMLLYNLNRDFNFKEYFRHDSICFYGKYFSSKYHKRQLLETHDLTFTFIIKIKNQTLAINRFYLRQ